MILEFKKVRAASRAYGRGSDNYYVPGRYAIIQDGVEIGAIVGRDRRYMDPGSWEIHERYTYDPGKGWPRWNAGQHLFTTLRDAKKHLVRILIKERPKPKRRTR